MTKITFCPGPGAFIPEWINNQKEYFGRGDDEYKKIKNKTFSWLKKITGKNEIVSIAGSGSTAAIISFDAFLYGKILIVKTGYYSDRWYNHLKYKNYKKISYIEYEKLNSLKESYDWIIFVYVETARCKKFDIDKINVLKKKLNSKLLLDATASIGLEKKHSSSDVMFFSSCKGLFGPTGLGFIAYDRKIKTNISKDFWLNIETHKNAKYTLGYNCMASLFKISKKHNYYKKKIIYASKILKKYKLLKNEAIIGCALKYKIKNKKLKNTIFYIPREKTLHDVIFFLGLIKLNKKKIKENLQIRIIDNLSVK